MPNHLPSVCLQGVLNLQEVSVQLASLLPSPDVKMVVPALQLAETLMQKLPDLCTSHFRREGAGRSDCQRGHIIFMIAF